MSPSVYTSFLCWSTGWWGIIVLPQVLQKKWGSMWWITFCSLPHCPQQPWPLCSWELPQVLSSQDSAPEIPFHLSKFSCTCCDITCFWTKFFLILDESFSSFYPEAHLPLSLIQDRPVYLEVSLVDPPEPDLVLLVHSCIAYTQARWMLIYDGCVFKKEWTRHYLKKNKTDDRAFAWQLQPSALHTGWELSFDYLTTSCLNLFPRNISVSFCADSTWMLH